MKKRSNSSMMIRFIVLLLAFVVMVFVATFSWFSPPYKDVTAEGVSISTKGSAEFDMAVGFKSSVNGYQYIITDYSKQLNLSELVSNGQTYDVFHDFSPIDVTSDGVTFIRPTMLAKNADIDRNSGVFTSVTPNKEYISFDMYFRSSDPCNVFLGEDTYVIAMCESEVGDGSLLTDTTRRASEGEYSKDAVVGAVRVSFVGYNQYVEAEDDSNLNTSADLLWLPRPDIHLNTSDKPWTLATGVTEGQYVDTFGEMQCDTYTHHYYSFKDGSGKDYNYGSTKTVANNSKICVVNERVGNFYYGKVQVNIWIEGCDAEARRTISGGKFFVNFDLSAG